MPRRPTLTCRRCREKRIKCDKESPCSSCIKNKTPNLCVFDENNDLLLIKGGMALHVFKVSKSVTKKPKAKVTKLATDMPDHYVTGHEDTIDFHDLYFEDNTTSSARSPLEWSFIERKEPALRFLQTWKISTDNTPQERSGVEDQRPLVERIEEVLPEKNAVLHSIKCFFDEVYFFVPLVDYVMFNDDMARILEPRGNGCVLRLTQNSDLANVGILLTVLSFLGLLRSFETDFSNRVSYIQKISLAKLCLRQHTIRNDIYLPVLQLATCLRLFHRVVPDTPEFQSDGDSVLTSTLVHMAYQLQLDRKPENFSPRECNLRGKLWHLITILDTMEATLIGTPLVAIRSTSTKTLLPVGDLTSEASNTPNVELEMAIVSFFGNLSPLLATLRDMIELVLNKTGTTKVSKLAEYVQLMETLMETVLGTLKGKLTTMPKNASAIYVHHKALSIKSLLNYGTFLLSLYTHIRVYFEHKNDIQMAFHYEKKIIQLTVTELLPIVTFIADDPKQYYGPMGALVTTKFFISTLQRSSFTGLSTLTRLRYHLHHYDAIYGKEDTDTHFLLQKVTTKSEICCKIYWQSLRRLIFQFQMDPRPAEKIRDTVEFLSDGTNLNTGAFDKIWRFRYTKEQLLEIIDLYDSGLEDISYSEESFGSSTSLSTDSASPLFDFNIDFDYVAESWMKELDDAMILPDIFLGI